MRRGQLVVLVVAGAVGGVVAGVTQRAIGAVVAAAQARAELRALLDGMEAFVSARAALPAGQPVVQVGEGESGIVAQPTGQRVRFRVTEAER